MASAPVINATNATVTCYDWLNKTLGPNCLTVQKTMNTTQACLNFAGSWSYTVATTLPGLWVELWNDTEEVCGHYAPFMQLLQVALTAWLTYNVCYRGYRTVYGNDRLIVPLKTGGN